jgi:putative ABC transport system permease protein
MEVFRNIGRRRLRSALTISGIAIGIFALTVMGAMAEHYNSLLDGGVKYFGSNVQVSDGSGSGSSLLPTTKANEIERVRGVRAAIPSIQLPAKPFDNSAATSVPDFISSSDDREEAYSRFKTSLASGRRVRSRGEVLLGSAFASEFHKKVGDTISLPIRTEGAPSDLQSYSYNVVGVLKKTGTGPDNAAFVSLADAQVLLGGMVPPALREQVDPSKFVSGITVYGKPDASLAELDALAARINREVPGVRAIKPSVLVDAFERAGATLTAVTTGAALLALVIGGLSVVNTMIMSVSERVREIGLKKAIGARRRHIIGEYLLEATMIGALGGATGFVGGAAVTTLINAAGRSANLDLDLFLITPTLTVIALVFAVALGALAGIVPAWRAARLDPVIALRAQ